MGVHIADVSYFVEEGSVLDATAGQRATSVYLVQKVGARSDWPPPRAGKRESAPTCSRAGDPHAAEAAVRGAVQFKSSQRQTHFLRYLENHAGGEGRAVKDQRQLFSSFLSLIPLHPPSLLDPERVVRPLGHPLLREVKLRPRSEHDRGPRENVFSGGAAAGGPRPPHRPDPSGCAQPARHCQKPASSALHRRGAQTRPGLFIYTSTSDRIYVDL